MEVVPVPTALIVKFLVALSLGLKLPVARFPLIVALPALVRVATFLLLALQFMVTCVLLRAEAVEPLTTIGRLSVLPCLILIVVMF